MRLLLPNRGAIRSSNEVKGVFSEHAQESGCYKALTVLTLSVVKIGRISVSFVMPTIMEQIER